MTIKQALNPAAELDEWIESTQDVNIGELVRGFEKVGITNFATKCAATTKMKTLRLAKGTYPYNRVLRDGNTPSAQVFTMEDRNSEQECIVWNSNHYLGLNRNSEVINAAAAGLRHYGTGTGTCAIMGGLHTVHMDLSEELARFIGKEDAILFPTGFTTNSGFIGMAAKPGDLIIFDRDCHASIIEGVKISGAEYRAYRHLDANDLERILKSALKKNYANIFVLTETVFSLSGEEAPLVEICALKDRYAFYLFIDEAHAFGIYGENGCGFAEEHNCTGKADYIMSTLSKATASVGGFVAADSATCDYMRVNANPYMFQAVLPPADAAAALAALGVIKISPELRASLWEKTGIMRSKLQDRGFDIGKSRSPIIPVYISADEQLNEVCKRLYQRGVFTNAIQYPGVKKGHGRLRFIVTAAHSVEQIDYTVDSLSKVFGELGMM